MIAIETIITRLQTIVPTYTIAKARSKEPDLAETAALPIIYVGYGTIDSKNPNQPIELDTYSMNGEDLVQSFDIQIVCKEIDLKTIWTATFKALIGWNPVTVEQMHSSMTYSQGGVIGISNDNIWWLDRYRIGFPTTIPL